MAGQAKDISSSPNPLVKDSFGHVWMLELPPFLGNGSKAVVPVLVLLFVAL